MGVKKLTPEQKEANRLARIKAQGEKEYAAIMERTRYAMAHPAANCQIKWCKKPISEGNRYWDGSKWVCPECDEKYAK